MFRFVSTISCSCEEASVADVKIETFPTMIAEADNGIHFTDPTLGIMGGSFCNVIGHLVAILCSDWSVPAVASL